MGVEGCSRADGLQGAERGVKDKEVGKACGCLLERRKRGNLKMAGRWGAENGCPGVWFSVPVSGERRSLGEGLQVERKDWPGARKDESNREMPAFERHLGSLGGEGMWETQGGKKGN